MSEAERLADLMGAAPKGPGFIEYSPVTIHKAAAELRRLSAELAALKAAIESQGVPDGYARIAELEQHNRDLYEDVQRFKEHALSEKDARMALEQELAEVRKDAERYRWLAWTSDTQPIVIYEIGTGQIMFGNKANDTIDTAMKGPQ